MLEQYLIVGFPYFVATFVAIGTIGLATRVWNQSKSRQESSTPKVQVGSTEIQEEQLKLLNLYMEEWKTTIEVQTHFNDLIMRFRTSTLTVFVTALGAVVTLARLTSGLHKSDVIFLAALPIVLWSTAFVIDYFYYHRLLLGAVSHSSKFDKMPGSLGLFGLTTSISETVKPPTSRTLLVIYYFVPLAGTGVLFLVLYGKSFFQLPN